MKHWIYWGQFSSHICLKMYVWCSSNLPTIIVNRLKSEMLCSIITQIWDMHRTHMLIQIVRNNYTQVYTAIILLSNELKGLSTSLSDRNEIQIGLNWFTLFRPTEVKTWRFITVMERSVPTSQITRLHVNVAIVTMVYSSLLIDTMMFLLVFRAGYLPYSDLFKQWVKFLPPDRLCEFVGPVFK